MDAVEDGQSYNGVEKEETLQNFISQSNNRLVFLQKEIERKQYDVDSLMKQRAEKTQELDARIMARTFGTHFIEKGPLDPPDSIEAMTNEQKIEWLKNYTGESWVLVDLSEGTRPDLGWNTRDDAPMLGICFGCNRAGHLGDICEQITHDDEHSNPVRCGYPFQLISCLEREHPYYDEAEPHNPLGKTIYVNAMVKMKIMHGKDSIMHQPLSSNWDPSEEDESFAPEILVHLPEKTFISLPQHIYNRLLRTIRHTHDVSASTEYNRRRKRPMARKTVKPRK